MKKYIVYGTLCGAAIATVALIFKLCSFGEKELPEVPSRMVKLFKVNSTHSANTIVYPGRIEAEEHADLFFRVSGPVTENSLELGMRVKKGDLIMQLDPRDYQREVIRLGHELDMMRAKFVYLTREYERMERLIKSNATSRTLFESALSTKDAYAAEIKSKETALQIAKDRLSDTRLIAPFDGVIIRIGIEKFEMAKANEVVVSLHNLEKLNVVVNIPEGNIPEVSSFGSGGLLGKKYPVAFPGRDFVFNAELTEFSPAASAENGTYELRLTMIKPPDCMILPGMTAEVRGLPGRQSVQNIRPRLPFSAVFNKNGHSFVWRYDRTTEKLLPVKIKTGEIHGKFIECNADDLPDGSFIAGAGGDWLVEGIRVNIMNPEVLHESH